MKKVLIVFDGTHFSTSSFEFAAWLNSMSPILLTGVFLPQTDLANLWSRGAGGGWGNSYMPLVETIDSAVIQQNIDTFSRLCVNNNIEFRVHKDVMDFAMPELKNESRFADLLVISCETFYSNVSAQEQHVYLQEAFGQSECPVVVIPEKYERPRSLILAYDGTKSSVFAIKQFAYLFPELLQLPALLVYADGRGEDFPDENNIEELAARHYTNLTFLRLEMNPKKYFGTWLREQEGALLVTGSYGRSGWSKLLKSSFAGNIISEKLCPVFIAHT